MDKTTIALITALLTIVAVIVIPMVTISAINILFSTQIPISFINWIAMYWLLVILTIKHQINK